MTFCTGGDWKRRRKGVIKITTGSVRFDELLGGGIETGSITEIFGATNSGKTQICHQLCVTTQFPISSRGGEGCVIYIDTAGTFRPKRIAQMAERFGMDDKDCLNNISFARCYTSDHQFKLLKEAEAMMTTSHYKLIIVDSGTGLFRSEYGELFVHSVRERNEKLTKFYSALQRLCDIYDVAVVITNKNEMYCPNGIFRTDDKTFANEICGSLSATRVYLRKSSKSRRIAKIVKAPDLENDECGFEISKEGIED